MVSKNNYQKATVQPDGTISISDLSKDEIAQYEKDQAEFAEQARLIEAETTAKAQAKESAMAKLRKLGLTDDEIAGLIS